MDEWYYFKEKQNKESQMNLRLGCKHSGLVKGAKEKV